jgi:hypothetical protein
MPEARQQGKTGPGQAVSSGSCSASCCPRSTSPRSSTPSPITFLHPELFETPPSSLISFGDSADCPPVECQSRVRFQAVTRMAVKDGGRPLHAVLLPELHPRRFITLRVTQIEPEKERRWRERAGTNWRLRRAGGGQGRALTLG